MLRIADLLEPASVKGLRKVGGIPLWTVWGFGGLAEMAHLTGFEPLFRFEKSRGVLVPRKRLADEGMVFHLTHDGRIRGY
jgi:hypothetical protein